jgi:cytochrome c2
LRHPRGWRAKTSMPNLWPRPLDPASKLPYVDGSPEDAAWKAERTEETLAVAAFLWERSENPSGRPGGATNQRPLREKIEGRSKVAGASAEHGKEIFEAYGCQGCHAVTSSGPDVPEAWRGRERDIAPTLSNMKSKIQSPDWIAYWVSNPSQYWHGTSMPNLRLNDVEAASVAQYLITLEDKAPAAAAVEKDEVKHITDPKLRAEEMVCAQAGGAKLSRVACGQKIVEKRGCYGCHNISGFEKFAPIGPELTGFGQKDISTLDFGYAISDHHLQTTETFAALKVDSPRIYVRDRIQLFMGDFDASADEIRALTLFLKGAVNGKPNKDFDPMQQEEHAAVVRGRQLVNDLNCRGCHIIEGRGADIDQWASRAQGLQERQMRAPYLDGEGARVQPEWLFTFLRDPAANGIRPWLHPEWAYGDEVPAKQRALHMPTFNLTAEDWTDIVRYFASWDGEAYPFQVPKVRELDKQEKLWAASNMNSTQTGNCMSCHYYREFPVERAKGDLKKMAPDLDNVRRRLRPGWVKEWILRPQNYLDYTAMTAFFASKPRDKTAALFPGQEDPFISPKPPGWEKIIPGFREVPVEEHVDLLRDFLFSFPDGATWPAVGSEASSVLVDPEAAKAAAAAEPQPPADGGQPPGEPAPQPQPGG